MYSIHKRQNLFVQSFPLLQHYMALYRKDRISSAVAAGKGIHRYMATSTNYLWALSVWYPDRSGSYVNPKNVAMIHCTPRYDACGISIQMYPSIESWTSSFYTPHTASSRWDLWPLSVSYFWINRSNGFLIIRCMFQKSWGWRPNHSRLNLV